MNGLNYIIILLLLPICLFSQTGNIKGVIKCEGEVIPFANILLEGSNFGVASDFDGCFQFKNIPIGKYNIRISAIGYEKYSQSITVINGKTTDLDIRIDKISQILDEVVITGTLKEVSIRESAVPVEVFKPVYFKKNPTPSLFQALQIVNGVRPQINCSVCNTGDVHINGMEGPYTMITIDGMPVIGGLASVYGLNGIPNSMIYQLEVVKGPASTLYGSEAVGGLINVITKSPENSPRFSFDILSNSWGEVNSDFSTRYKKGNVTSMLGVNYFNYSIPIDKNGDNFTDLTLQNRISVFNKWSLKRKSDRMLNIGLRYIYEDRWGGEMQWTPRFRGGDSIYGESINTKRYEVMGKYQLPINENIFFSFSYSDHAQNSAYGQTLYIADQDIAYTQLHWDKKIRKSHSTLLGIAFRYTYYDDNTAATFSSDTTNPFNRPNKIFLPGVFIQDDINLTKKSKLLLGIRYDYDSRHGSIFTPRANYKYSPNKDNIIRFSFGTGYRVVNLFTEDHAATTGSRDVVIIDKLKPEKSINGNLHYQKFISTKIGFINFDGSLFFTYFSNKIIPDYETNVQQIIYNNIEGYAISKGFSFNTSFNFSFPLKIKIGGTFLDVYQKSKDLNGEIIKTYQLLTEKVSGTYSVSYHIKKPNIKIDYSGNLFGPMKLPLVENDFRPEYSDWYSIQNIQITKKFKKNFEIYGGLKNILNFTPPAYSILRANDPFDKNVNNPDNPNGYTFDPTYVYAANQGIRVFLGVRYTLK